MQSQINMSYEYFRGGFIREYVGEVLGNKEFRHRVKQYARDQHRHYYFMALSADEIIDATQKGNISRFINHSCDPNSETQKVNLTFILPLRTILPVMTQHWDRITSLPQYFGVVLSLF